MKEKKDCKIIQDLLPNYIEELTNQETNKYIEEHLENCKECKDMLKNMKSNINYNDKKIDKKEINYIKKFSNKMKFLKIAISLIIIICVVIIGRKMFIIGELKNKLNEKLEENNYYLKSYSYFGGETTMQESFVKENKYIHKILTYPNNMETIEYYDGSKSNTYITKDNKKLALLSKENDNPFSMKLTKIQNFLYTEDIFDFIKMALNSSIMTEPCNGKQCYRINTKGQILYIDKETGLPVRITTGSSVENQDTIVDIIYDYFYDFNCVTENDFVQPDISNYEIK